MSEFSILLGHLDNVEEDVVPSQVCLLSLAPVQSLGLREKLTGQRTQDLVEGVQDGVDVSML